MFKKIMKHGIKKIGEANNKTSRKAMFTTINPFFTYLKLLINSSKILCVVY